MDGINVTDILNAIMEPSAIVDFQGNILASNKSFAETIAVEKDFLQSLDFYLSGDVEQWLMTACSTKSHIPQNIVIRTRDGSKKKLHAALSLINNSSKLKGRRLLLRLFKTEVNLYKVLETNKKIYKLQENYRRERNESKKFARESMTDILTGLPNRRSLETKIKQVVTKVLPDTNISSFSMIDVDDFKMFNDTYGHITGDLVLSEVGKLLSKTFRANDLVCRYGGDEFFVFLAADSKDIISKRLNMIHNKLRESRPIPGNTNVSLRLSIGTYYIENKHINLNDIKDYIEKADKALYESKNTGKNKLMEYIGD